MTQTSHRALVEAREAFEHRAWDLACTKFAAAHESETLGPDDLELYAQAAFLAGRDELSTGLLARAHQRFLDDQSVERAVGCAFWLAMELANAGDMAQAGGWLGRAQRLLEEHHLDCVEQGYMLIASALHAFESGDAAGANATFAQAEKIAQRFGDKDLLAMARLGQGQTLAHLGEVQEGMALLDEVMVSVTAGELSPIPAGVVYCAVIEACFEVFDLHRAQEWTEALNRWCDEQPGLVAFRGQCLVRRAEVLELRGEWEQAAAETERALQLLQGRPSAGLAMYVQAELCRLRGRFGDAEELYRKAHGAGRLPHPGLSQLRLAQGRVADAQSAMTRVMDEAQDQLIQRAQLLAAFVEIALASGDLPAGRRAAGELEELAGEFGSPALRAVADEATGRALLAGGRADEALAKLRGAWRFWADTQAPYAAARVQVQIGLACRELGDTDGADLEFDGARAVFSRLGALPDAEQTEALARTGPSPLPGGLTEREAQVLRLVAAGNTNRQIARELVLSDKTVARHLSNIFTKLGVSSRSAATSYAYQNRLL